MYLYRMQEDYLMGYLQIVGGEYLTLTIKKTEVIRKNDFCRSKLFIELFMEYIYQTVEFVS
ncbi:hypothetical protein [Bacillus sp. 71mf]|nr:hypothetical protein [Bacillus sp. 71mf]